MKAWGPGVAIEVLQARYGGAGPVGYSASYDVRLKPLRQIAVATRRVAAVSIYVNALSAGSRSFPGSGIDGVTVMKTYMRGHAGTNGNPGIAGSIARRNASLDPARNDVLLLRIRDVDSLERLLRWYEA